VCDLASCRAFVFGCSLLPAGSYYDQLEHMELTVRKAVRTKTSTDCPHAQRRQQHEIVEVAVEAHAVTCVSSDPPGLSCVRQS
jgi:hypothetical protein